MFNVRVYYVDARSTAVIGKGKRRIAFQHVEKVPISDEVELKSAIVPYCGCPMALLKGRQTYECHKGKNRGIRHVKKNKEKQQQASQVSGSFFFHSAFVNMYLRKIL